jgi:hypothetical protein
MQLVAGHYDVQFSADYSTRRYRVLELSEELLDALVVDGARVPDGGMEQCRAWFVGADAGDEAAFVTADATYAVRVLDSSNSQILAAADGPASLSLVGAFSGHMALTPAAARVDRLFARLFRNPIRPSTSPDQGHRPEGLQWDALQHAAACSAVELRSALRGLGAFEWHDGTWRVLDPAYETRLVDELLSACRADGVDPTVPFVDVRAAALRLLPDEPPAVAVALLRRLGGDGEGRSDTPVAIDVASVSRVRAAQILRAAAAVAPVYADFRGRLRVLLARDHDLWGDVADTVLDAALDGVVVEAPAGARGARGGTVAGGDAAGDAYSGTPAARGSVAYLLIRESLPATIPARAVAMLEFLDEWFENPLRSYLRPLFVSTIDLDSAIQFHFRRIQAGNSGSVVVYRRK